MLFLYSCTPLSSCNYIVEQLATCRKCFRTSINLEQLIFVVTTVWGVILFLFFFLSVLSYKGFMRVFPPRECWLHVPNKLCFHLAHPYVYLVRICCCHVLFVCVLVLVQFPVLFVFVHLACCSLHYNTKLHICDNNMLMCLYGCMHVFKESL